MALRVNYNGTASSALRGFASSQARFDRSSARLASGLRIGSASDDAGGMTIAEGLKGQTRGYLQAKRNIQDGISLLQTAEAALAEDHALLSRMRELAIFAPVGTVNGGLVYEIGPGFNEKLLCLTSEFANTSSAGSSNKKLLLKSIHTLMKLA